MSLNKVNNLRSKHLELDISLEGQERLLFSLNSRELIIDYTIEAPYSHSHFKGFKNRKAGLEHDYVKEQHR